MSRRYRFVGILAGAVAMVLTYQNCANFRSMNFANQSSSSSFGAQTFVNPGSFTDGYEFPRSKQGTGEARMVMSPGEADARYQKLQALGAGYRGYNLPWREFEDAAAGNSQTQPFACPADHVLVPGSETERASLGFHRFRCLNNDAIAKFDNLFVRDQRAGMQSGATIYYNPQQYRYAGCTGQTFAGNHSYDGCVPRDDAMDDFEDFVNFAASRWNGGANGKISHFIIWNENASPDWFDLSPIVSHSDLSPGAVNLRLNKMADMMIRAHNALARHQTKAMLYVSTDQLWTSGQVPGHFGTRALLEGLWARLGTNYAWSVSVHPYGAVDAKPPASIYTFNNLEMVSSFQAAQLSARGVVDPLSMPQAYLIAAEQGWPVNADHGREGQARQMCLAHEKVMSMPQVLAVGHNYFHSVEPQEVSNGVSSQGTFFGLIPATINNALDGVEDTATGQAFIATMNPAYWNQRADHYCCRVYSLGCPGEAPHLSAPSVVETHQVNGVIDAVSNVNGQIVVAGWACTRSMEPSIQVHLFANGPAGQGTGLGAFTADQPSDGGVSAACAVSGAHGYRFKIPLGAGVVAQYPNAPVYVHGISLAGLSNALLGNSGTFRLPTIAPANVVPTPIVSPPVASNPVATAPAPGGAPATTMVQRFFNLEHHDHFLTTNYAEGQAANYNFDGGAFRLLTNQAAGSAPLYRCFGGGHFVSRSANCEGAGRNEGTLGYVYDQPVAGTIALNRYFHETYGDHLSTVNPNESNLPGYRADGLQGYVFAP